MPVSARGVWTPADSDDWDLTVDLAAMATSIDVALGTAVTQAIAGAALPDTGWVSFSSSMTYPGELVARNVGDLVFVRGSINSGHGIASGVSVSEIMTTPLPSQFSSTGGNAMLSAYGSGVSGLIVVRPAGTMAITNRIPTLLLGSIQFSGTYRAF